MSDRHNYATGSGQQHPDKVINYAKPNEIQALYKSIIITLIP